MRRISNKLKLSLLLSCIVCLWNCTENIDTSARYVFSEETILSYLEKHEAYSSYVEIVVPFRLGGADWTAQAGAVPFATTSYEANGFAVTNLSLRATKIIDITKTFSLPLFAGITANPCAQKAYFVFGLTLQP